MLCELAQAGYRKKGQTMYEIRRVNQFLLPPQPGDLWSSTWPEAHRQGCSMDCSPCWMMTKPALLDSWRCYLPFFFSLSHTKAGISSVFDKVPLRLSQVCVIQTQIFFLSNKQICMIYVVLAPSCKFFSVFRILTNLPLFSHKYWN